MPIINMYGKIREENTSYDLCGQPFLALTYAMRALHEGTNVYQGVNNAVNRETDIFINAASPTTFEHAKVWIMGYVNAWAHSVGTTRMNMGTVAAPVFTIVDVPKCRGGGRGYRALLVGVAQPAAIVTALDRLIFLEDIPNGAIWNAAQVNAAAGHGIQVVHFTRDDFERVTAQYGTLWQPRVLKVLQTRYNMVPVKSCGDTGTLAQVVRRERPAFGHAPEKVIGSDADLGWMMSGGLSYSTMEPERYVVTSKSSPNELMVRYFSGMRKH